MNYDQWKEHASGSVSGLIGAGQAWQTKSWPEIDVVLFVSRIIAIYFLNTTCLFLDSWRGDSLLFE